MRFEDHFPDPRLIKPYSYWRERRGARRMPGRADIDPGQLLPLLPYLMLIDVIDGGRQFRYRLVGTELERHIGPHVSGQLVDHILSGPYLAYIRSLYERLIAEAAPLYAENNYDGTWRGFTLLADLKRAHRLLLPLSNDGSTVNMILGGAYFDPIRAIDDAPILAIDDTVGSLP